MIKAVHAILIISDDAPKLAEFYRKALGVPLEDEEHEGVALHYGCDIGPVHLAIHPKTNWGEAAETGAGGIRLVFETASAHAVADRLRSQGLEFNGPTDHGFAEIVSLRDPDGNLIELLEPKS